MLPAIAWRRMTALSAAGSLARPASAAGGSLAKASSVGAKTVKGPGPDRVSTRPAAFSCADRVANPGMEAAD
jgi:hypothetical protein